MADTRLKKFLKKIGKSQAVLAKETNVHINTIHKYTTGKMMPGFDFLKKMHDSYDLNINWLLSGKGEMQVTSPYIKFNHLMNYDLDHLSDNKIQVVTEKEIPFQGFDPEDVSLLLEISQLIKIRPSARKIFETIVDVNRSVRKDDGE